MSTDYRIRTGIVPGTFLPLNANHINLIEEALKENDEVIIALFGSDQDHGRNFVPFLRRQELLEKIYGRNPKIIIVRVDRRKLSPTDIDSPENRAAWGKELFSQACLNPSSFARAYCWYSNESQKLEAIAEIYPKHSRAYLKRLEIGEQTFLSPVNTGTVPLTGRLIRQNPMKYKDYIHPVFFEYLLINLV